MRRQVFERGGVTYRSNQVILIRMQGDESMTLAYLVGVSGDKVHDERRYGTLPPLLATDKQLSQKYPGEPDYLSAISRVFNRDLYLPAVFSCSTPF
jgi:hypothetical protein